MRTWASRRRWIASLSFTALLAGLWGCGPTGFKITPIPVDRRLVEETLIHEGGFAPPKIVLVDVDGILLNRRKPTLLGDGEQPVSLFAEKLAKAAADRSVEGVVIRINSPGGTVTASDLMHQEILHYKLRTEGRNPVVAVLMDVGASGGYYIACAADEIIAHPTTVTGSIGVMMQMVDLSGTLMKIGVQTDAIKSGPSKDAGSPLRRMTEAEREIFQGLVDRFYDRFIQVVAAGRPGMDEEQVRELADGRVYAAEEALELGFVDRIGTLREALAYVKLQTGHEKVRVVTYRRPLGYKPNIYAEHQPGPPQVNLLNVQLPGEWPFSEPQFMYIWAPGQ